MRQRSWRLVRVWLVPVAAGWAVLALVTLAIGRLTRRRASAAPAPIPSERLQPDPAAGSEAWARRVLGVGAFAAPHEIEAAFRSLMGQYHPDKVAHLGAELRAVAEAKARDLVRARDVLRKLLGPAA